MLKLISYVTVFIVGFAICAGLFYTLPHSEMGANAQRPAVAAMMPTGGPAAAGESALTAGPGTTIYAVSKVEPSVVNIDITGTPAQAPEAGPSDMPFPFPGMPNFPQGEPVMRGQA